MRESQVEAYLVKRVKEAGGAVRKLRWLCRNGAPDRVVMFADGTLVFVEVKRSGGRVRLEQKLEHDDLRAMGQRVVIVSTLEAVDELIHAEANCRQAECHRLCRTGESPA